MEMRRRLNRLFREPHPVRFVILRGLGRIEDAFRVKTTPIGRPHYRHCLMQAASLAKALGHSRISAIEFGVAGGNGLLALERHAEDVELQTGVHVDTFGFDTGAGMPPPSDFRDIPYMWREGYYAMDEAALRSRLRHSQLVLGDVRETIGRFVRKEIAPIGFISFDLDYYSSTKAAFRIFEAEEQRLLPRVACYFDDMVGDIDCGYNEFTGELLAINEFNETHEEMKIARVRGLRYVSGNPQVWHEQIYVAHLFKHRDYGRHVYRGLLQLPLVLRTHAGPY